MEKAHIARNKRLSTFFTGFEDEDRRVARGLSNRRFLEPIRVYVTISLIGLP
jgi:hypothetical protein